MPQESVTANSNELFIQSLALQQEKKWDEALAGYQKLLDQSLENLSDNQASVIYHNMSSVAFYKGDLFKAYIWSKKAQFLDPSNAQARESYEFYAKKVEIPNIPHQISNTDNLKKIVNALPVDVWMFSSLVLILITIRFGLKKAVSIKRNKAAGEHNTPPLWLVYILCILSLCVLSGATLRYFENSKTKAVVLVEKAQIQTVPGENKPVIFEAQAGLELEVLNSDGNYFQVRHAGAFTGWINKSQLELLSLSFRQRN